MGQLEEQIKVVAEERRAYDRACDAKKISYQDWQDANSLLLSSLLETELKVKGTEAKLRELTLQAYSETGNKAPAVGVGIREVTKMEYDPKEAYTWATEHTMALKLDVAAFEKYVKLEPQNYHFVAVSQEPIATIATKLEVE